MAGLGPTQEPAGLDDADDVGSGGFNEINIIPLVDIMLVLLVILMAGSTAIITPPGAGEGAGFKVNLPSGAENDEVTSLSEELVVAVLEDGTVVARGEAVSMEGLSSVLQREASRSKERMVLVQADERALHKRVVEVMEAARRAGLNNLAIATRPEGR